MKDKKKFKKYILGIKPVDLRRYESFDLDRLMVLVLSSLEKEEIPLYSDYIAVACFKMFPQKFSMVSFKNYPDTNRVNKCLRRLTDQKRKGLATGSTRNGFFLTDLGRQTAEQVEKFIKGDLLYDKKEAGKKKSRGRSLEKDIKKIEESDLFIRWKDNDSKINDYEILSFLDAVPYAPKNLLLGHLKQLKEVAINADNNKVLEFLNWMEKNFNHIFH